MEVASPRTGRAPRATDKKSVKATYSNENFTNMSWVKAGKGYSVFKGGSKVLAAGNNGSLREAFLNKVRANATFANSHAGAGGAAGTSKAKGAAAGNNAQGSKIWGIMAGLKNLAVKGYAKIKLDPSRVVYIPGALSSAFYAVATAIRPMFSMSQLQSWSGSELETRAIELAVLEAKIKAVKFDRQSKKNGGAGQLFDVNQRTFFFKPRMDLNPIKDDRPEWKKVMADVVTASGGKAGKGENNVETDVIEAFPPGAVVAGVTYPNGLIRLYECKIGLGKPEGKSKAGESLQLIKAKRLISKHWESRHPNFITRGYPAIHCYFLAWKYGEQDLLKVGLTKVPVTKTHKEGGVDFTHHRVAFPDLSRRLRAAAGEGSVNQTDPNTGTFKHWDGVDVLDPDSFEKLTGLKKGFVSGFLDAHRNEILNYYRMLLNTLIGRGALHGKMGENVRRALGVRSNFVSGQGLTNPVPQEPNEAFQLRVKGQLGNYMNKWTPNYYSHLNKATQNQFITANKKYFSNKAIRAVARLTQQGIIDFTKKSGGKIRNLPQESASELQRPSNNGPRKKFTNQKNIDEYLKRVKVAIKKANILLPNSTVNTFKNAKLEILNKAVKKPNQKAQAPIRQAPAENKRQAWENIGYSPYAINMAFKNAGNFEKTYMNFLNQHGGPGGMAANEVRKILESKNMNNWANKLEIKGNMNEMASRRGGAASVQ